MYVTHVRFECNAARRANTTADTLHNQTLLLNVQKVLNKCMLYMFLVFVQKAIIMLLLDIKLVWKCIFPPEIFISLLIFFAPYMDFRNQSLYQVSVSLAICSINLYHKTNFRNIFFKVLRCIFPSWMSKCFLQMLNQIKYFFIKIFVPIWTLNAKKMHPKSLNYFPLCTRGQLRGPEGPYLLAICTQLQVLHRQ